jgi:hypothetical protein
MGAAFAVPVLLSMAHYTGTPAFNQWLWSELGPLETSHVLILLAVAVIGLFTLKSRQRIGEIRRAGLGWLAVSIGGVALLCGVIAGEEASWGQHLWGWSTPEAWNTLNDQHETNLHNVGTWADQKPRALVELSVILFGIVWPLVDRVSSVSVRPAWRQVLPPVGILPVALFAEGIRLVERVPEWLGTPAWAALPRPSELQELYFYTFFTLCLLSWRGRLLDRLEQAQEREAVPDSRRIPSRSRKRAA